MNQSFYQYQPAEGTVFVEIYLPKKAKYQAVLYDTLTGGFDYERVKKYLKDNLESIKELYNKISLFEDGMADWLSEFFNGSPPLYNGYSMYEVDGVFRGEQGEIIEERTQIIRIIFKPNLGEVFREFSFDRDEKKNQDKIREFIKTYLVIPHQLNRISVKQGIKIFLNEFKGENNIKELKKVIKFMIKWSESVGFFLFGYIMHNLCRRISRLREEENLKGEEEIWVTSLWHHKVNRIILNEKRPSGS